MTSCFCKKKRKLASPDERYNAWEEYIKKEDGLIMSTYENELYFAAASGFLLPKKNNENVTVIKLRKSVILYQETKKRTKEECPICLTNLQSKFSKKYVILECGHRFHTKCFHTHIKTQHSKQLIATCPLCRHGVSPDEEKIQQMKVRYCERDSHYDSD